MGCAAKLRAGQRGKRRDHVRKSTERGFLELGRTVDCYLESINHNNYIHLVVKNFYLIIII